MSAAARFRTRSKRRSWRDYAAHAAWALPAAYFVAQIARAVWDRL